MFLPGRDFILCCLSLWRVKVCVQQLSFRGGAAAAADRLDADHTDMSALRKGQNLADLGGAMWLCCHFAVNP